MKLYSSIGPNPRVVRMFAAEKGIALKLEEVDILAGDNRREPYLSINPAGTTPALQLDNGQIISEILPSCEYLEEIHPEPTLIGATPEARAAVRMWTRRIDLGFATPLTLAFRALGGRAMFAPRVVVAPEAAAPDLTAMARETVSHLERQCSGRPFVAGEVFSLADILLFCFVDFGRAVGEDVSADGSWLPAWLERVGSRPSASA